MRETVGPLEIRLCTGLRGSWLPGHAHAFAHATICLEGWLLVRRGEEVLQLASIDYRRRRDHAMDPLRPVRWPDRMGRFALDWIAPGDAVPEGAAEISWNPDDLAGRWGCWLNIPAQIEHEIVVLSDSGTVGCAYPHRDAAGRLIEAGPGDERAYG